MKRRGGRQSGCAREMQPTGLLKMGSMKSRPSAPGHKEAVRKERMRQKRGQGQKTGRERMRSQSTGQGKGLLKDRSKDKGFGEEVRGVRGMEEAGWELGLDRGELSTLCPLA